jgi:hypothetical protein
METQIKKYCNQKIGTDSIAYEVVEVINDKKVVIRQLDAKKITDMEFIVGGFAGHCTNNYEQEYEYSSNTQYPLETIKLHKAGWGYGQFRMADKPRYFYDYNF